jgi:GNAT superfamily N-acetyltransferase
MEITKSEILTPDEKEQIVGLWNTEYPKALSLARVSEFDEYLEKLSDKHYLLVTEQDRILGWLIYFIRDGERCFAMLLNSGVQGKGVGSALLKKAKEYNSALIGWVIDTNEHVKIDGSHYKSPIAFYEKAGFETLRDIVTKKNGINGIQVRWKREP